MGEVILTGSGGGSSKAGLPPSICKNMTIRISGTSVYLKWYDPQNTVIDKQYLCTWGGTKIVKKLGSYPKNENDGTLVVDNKIMGQYSATPYEDTIESGEDWKYAAFPYSTNGVYCYNDRNRFTEAIIYEYTINYNGDSNPSTKVAYPVGSLNENYNPAYMDYNSVAFNYGDWENAFFMPRPVMVKSDGTVDYELYKTDFRYKADGITASDYNNASYDGNVMIAFPQIWTKVEQDGTLLHRYIANKQVDENYKCYTHINRLGVLQDEIFVNAFQPCNISSKLRSIAGQTIMVSQSATTERTYAQANGQCWDMMDFGVWRMIEMLLVLMSKSMDTQTKFGFGRGTTANATTGELADKPMFYATSGTSNCGIKVFGIENLYGNYWKRILGAIGSANCIKYKLCDYTSDGSTVINYNLDGTGYKTTNAISGGSTGAGGSGYYAHRYGNADSYQLNEDGLFPLTLNGSSSTNDCDINYIPTDSGAGVAIVGGSYGSGAGGGAFALNLYNTASYAGAGIGGSLSCKPLS